MCTLSKDLSGYFDNVGNKNTCTLMLPDAPSDPREYVSFNLVLVKFYRKFLEKGLLLFCQLLRN